MQQEARAGAQGSVGHGPILESQKKKKKNTFVQTEIIHRTAEVTQNVIIIVIDLAPPWNCLWPVRHSVLPFKIRGFFIVIFFLFIYLVLFSRVAGRGADAQGCVGQRGEREKEHMTSTFGFVLGQMTNCVYIYSINRCWGKDTGSAVRYSRPYVS